MKYELGETPSPAIETLEKVKAIFDLYLENVKIK